MESSENEVEIEREVREEFLRSLPPVPRLDVEGILSAAKRRKRRRTLRIMSGALATFLVAGLLFSVYNRAAFLWRSGREGEVERVFAEVSLAETAAAELPVELSSPFYIVDAVETPKGTFAIVSDGVFYYYCGFRKGGRSVPDGWIMVKEENEKRYGRRAVGDYEVVVSTAAPYPYLLQLLEGMEVSGK